MIKTLTILTLMVFVTSDIFAMTEIAKLRDYNQKVYKKNRTQDVYRIHAGHIHYKDGTEFKEIDTTIVANPSGGFMVDKASYKAELPLYADELFKFQNKYEGANHFVNMIPVTDHVSGVVINNANGNYVAYPNAFGVGKSLRVYAYRHGLKEVVVIGRKPAVVEDMHFDFELTGISELKVREDDNTEWQRDRSLDFTGKDLRLGNDGEQKSYFRDALMWDSSLPIKSEKVTIQLYRKDGKTFLRKTIPASFLNAATYPVYTDHATSYYSGAGDGYVYVSASDGGGGWDAAHDASTGTGNFDTLGASSIYVRNNTSGFNKEISRMFIPIDTSGIDDSATVTAASLYMYGVSHIDNDNDSYAYVTVVQTSQTSTSSLDNDDFDEAGAADNPTEGIDVGDRGDISSLPTSSYFEFPLNSTGISWISKTGTSLLGLREGHDVEDVAIDCTASCYSSGGFGMSESSGTSQDPYLEVTTGAAPSGPVKGAIIVVS